MKIDNTLTREFLLTYPEEAARALEQVSVMNVAALFNVLPTHTVASVTAFMLPGVAAACLGAMVPEQAAMLLTELPLSYAGRIYRLLMPEKQDELSGHVPEKFRSRIRRHLEFSQASVGALLDPQIDMLPESVTVSDALRRIEHLDHAVGAEIYIVNDAHQLVGVIDLGRLLKADHHVRLRDLMNRKTQPISIHATVETLLTHPAWLMRRRLPVVERDNTLSGALDYTSLQDAVGEAGGMASRDPLENLLSLAGLYWLTVAQLLNSMLGIAGSRKGDGHER